jgi:hypothetical protein
VALGLEGGPRRAFGKSGLEGLGAGGGSVAGEEPTGLAGAHHIGGAPDFAAENGSAASEAFENGVREVVSTAGTKEKVAGGVVPRECVGAANVAGVMDGKVVGERVIRFLAPNEEAARKSIKHSEKYAQKQ